MQNIQGKADMQQIIGIKRTSKPSYSSIHTWSRVAFCHYRSELANGGFDHKCLYTGVHIQGTRVVHFAGDGTRRFCRRSIDSKGSCGHMAATPPSATSHSGGNFYLQQSIKEEKLLPEITHMYLKTCEL